MNEKFFLVSRTHSNVQHQLLSKAKNEKLFANCIVHTCALHTTAYTNLLTNFHREIRIEFYSKKKRKYWNFDNDPKFDKDEISSNTQFHTFLHKFVLFFIFCWEKLNSSLN